MVGGFFGFASCETRRSFEFFWKISTLRVCVVHQIVAGSAAGIQVLDVSGDGVARR